MKKKIVFFTGSRSEFDLMSGLYNVVDKTKKFKLSLIVSGSHSSKKFGNTYKKINQKKIKIDSFTKILNKFNSKKDIIKSISEVLTKNFNYLNHIKPHLVFLIGDRYETFSISLLCLILKIPVAHIHGGEVTEGSYDDNFRHSITKFSKYHFVSNSVFKKRVIQLGESPKNVFNVGGLGVDNIKRLKIIKKQAILNKFSIRKNYFLGTFHPSSLDSENSISYLKNFLSILKNYKKYDVIITYPNAEENNEKIIRLLNKYKKNNSNLKLYKSLGLVNYLSLMKYSKLVIGNSSSGIAEAPSFNVPTVNIGNRQKGRIFAKSIIQCDGNTNDIKKKIKKALSKKFLINLKNNKNPYGNGGASKKILGVLKNLNLDDLNITKSFYDIKK